MKVRFPLSTLCLSVAVVALVFALVLLTARHNAQLMALTQAHNAQLLEQTERFNAQLEAQAARFQQELAGRSPGALAPHGTAAKK